MKMFFSTNKFGVFWPSPQPPPKKDQKKRYDKVPRRKGPHHLDLPLNSHPGQNLVVASPTHGTVPIIYATHGTICMIYLHFHGCFFMGFSRMEIYTKKTSPTGTACVLGHGNLSERIVGALDPRSWPVNFDKNRRSQKLWPR